MDNRKELEDELQRCRLKLLELESYLTAFAERERQLAQREVMLERRERAHEERAKMLDYRQERLLWLENALESRKSALDGREKELEELDFKLKEESHFQHDRSLFLQRREHAQDEQLDDERAEA